MLEALTVERDRHDRHRNLVVAATGTGKTVVAALDYRQLVAQRGLELSTSVRRAREEIRRQSLASYPAVLGNGAFGEIHGGGRIAEGRARLRSMSSITRLR
jgi:superfamily II DNA or RNA helicase